MLKACIIDLNSHFFQVFSVCNQCWTGGQEFPVSLVGVELLKPVLES